MLLVIVATIIAATFHIYFFVIVKWMMEKLGQSQYLGNVNRKRRKQKKRRKKRNYGKNWNKIVYIVKREMNTTKIWKKKMKNSLQLKNK